LINSPTSLHIAEPPAQYLLRPPIVIDCSVIAGILFQEEWRVLGEQRIAQRDLHAPFLLQAEFANVAVKKSRQGAALAASEGLDQFRQAEIEFRRINVEQTVTLAQQYSLSAYDAAYLWLAAELKCPLATFDDKLAAAARAHLAGLQ
jgi:predicted nucleic acid-binding protein